MAKETKKETKNVVATNEENVMEILKGGNRIQEDIAEEALKDLEKEEREKKKREFIRAKSKADYQNIKALLQLRARRREEKATKEWLTATKALLDELSTGKVTPIEYEEKRREAAKTRDKAMSESNTQFRKEQQELQHKYPGYWCYEWED